MLTDSEVVAAIRKIITARSRVKGTDKLSIEARDLARYDLIVGLMNRHAEPPARGEPVDTYRSRAAAGDGPIKG